MRVQCNVCGQGRGLQLYGDACKLLLLPCARVARMSTDHLEQQYGISGSSGFLAWLCRKPMLSIFGIWFLLSLGGLLVCCFIPVSSAERSHVSYLLRVRSSF